MTSNWLVVDTMKIKSWSFKSDNFGHENKCTLGALFSALTMGTLFPALATQPEDTPHPRWYYKDGLGGRCYLLTPAVTEHPQGLKNKVNCSFHLKCSILYHIIFRWGIYFFYIHLVWLCGAHLAHLEYTPLIII